MVIHELKCWPNFFHAIWNRNKTFEYRINDRGFSLYDTLWLREFDPKSETYTGREITGKIIYLLSSADLGTLGGYVIMQMDDIFCFKAGSS